MLLVHLHQSMHNPPSPDISLLESVCPAFHFLVSPVRFPGSSHNGHCSDYSTRLFLKVAQDRYYRAQQVRTS